MSLRDDIVRVARSYIGTPFHHMGRRPGVGLDCAGVVICVAKELSLVPLEFAVPSYSPSPDGTLLMLCKLHMTRIEESEMQPGDVIVLRRFEEPQHMGVLGAHRHGGLSLIHAASTSLTRGRVVETRLVFDKTQQFVAAFRLPGVE